MRPSSLLLRLPAAALLAALALSPPLFASARSKNEEGNRLYKEKKYDEALKRYTEAQLEAPDAPQLHYNLGNVLFRKGDLEKARDEYLRALAAADPGLDPRAVYNMGNAFFSQQQYKEAISAYQRALKLNPSDPDAKRNLELALLRMQQQKQQQQQQKQKQGDKKNDQGQKQPQPQQPRSGDEKNQNQGEKKEQGQEPQSASRRDKGSLSKEEAERILNALQEDEKENMKKRMETAKQDQEEVDKDW